MRPLAYAASVLMGARAFAGSAVAVLLAGSFVHLALSATLGVIYVLLGLDQLRGAAALLAGAAFGAGVWLLGTHLVARVWFPWFLDTRQGLQLVAHAFAFGAPLGRLLSRPGPAISGFHLRVPFYTRRV